MDDLPKLIPRSLDDPWMSPQPELLPHILLVVDQFPKALGGGERTVLRLAELLPLYGFRASVLTFAIHPESQVLRTPLPFPVYLLPLTRTWDWSALRSAFALGRFLRQQHVQLVQTFFESSDLWAGVVAKAFSSAKLIWSRRDMGILRAGKHRVAYRLLSGLPDEVFAVSDSVRRHCIEVDKIDPLKACTIYSGLDLDRYEKPLNEVGGRFLITTVGNVRHVKGHDVFLRAAALVREQFPEQFPRMLFRIVGEVLEPEYGLQLQDLVRELGLSGWFEFAGPAPDPRQHLAASSLFVLPSRSEGFSNAILEAMASSLPVIATEVGGNAEAVQDGVNGFLISTDDPSALARHIGRLADDPDQARRMGEAGRRLAEEKFSTRAMMQQITSHYVRLIAIR